MLLALKPFACLSLFCLSLIVFLLAPLENHTFRIPKGNHYPTNHAHYHHHLLQAQQQKVIKHRISSSHDDPPPTCSGRRIYIHKLPPQFNTELLRQCGYVITSWLNFCPHIAYHGLGQPLHTHEITLKPSQVSTPSSPPAVNDSSFQRTTRRLLFAYSSTDDDARLLGGSAPPRGFDWHRTDTYMLEVIFHQRLLHYGCLTEDPDMADAFYLPYYAGLDALKYLYGKQSGSEAKMQHGLDLVSWLQEDAIAREAWKRHRGQDHFLIMGRTPWDFVNLGFAEWGTGILHIPEFENMTVLLIEKQPWKANQHAIPYPTSFHPRSSSALHAWMERIRRIEERPTLFAFAGTIRPELMKDGIRDMLLDQCMASNNCRALDCKELKCSHNPGPIMKAFLQSQFCLQPRGDTPTRRSLFDAIIAGCIPVLFHKDTAYTQYKWHLPEEAEKWSVYMDEEEIRKGVLVEETLSKYTQDRIVEMREVLIGMIPKVVYGGVSWKQGEADAFDVSVRETLKVISVNKMKLGKT